MFMNVCTCTGLIYAIDYLWANIDWLEEKLTPLTMAATQCCDDNDDQDNSVHFVFDLPGQSELFTLSGSMYNIVETIHNKWRIRLAAVQLIDATLCMDAGK